MSKRSYTDEFRADAVLLAETKGSIAGAAEQLDMPESTLRSWVNAKNKSGTLQRNAPPAEMYDKKRIDLRELIEDELQSIFNAMGVVRDEASYRDLGWVAGVLIDKKQVLAGEPTAIIKLQKAIETGQLTTEEVKNRWPNLADKLFSEAGLDVGNGY